LTLDGRATGDAGHCRACHPERKMERMKKWIALCFVSLLAACSREVPVVQEQSVMAPPKPQPPAISYYEGTHALDAIQQIRAKVGEPFRVLKIRIDDDSIMVQAQDPKKHENVDEYRISRAELKPAIPVRLFGESDQEALEANLFDPADVDFTKIPELVREANEKVQLEGRELSSISIDRDMFNDHRPIIVDVNYRGSRKNGYLRADRKGTHTTVSIF
jgi:hypothetical protein